MLNDLEFTALADKYMDMVYRVAYNCVRAPADADDVTQNVMVRLYRARQPFRDEAQAHPGGGERVQAAAVRPLERPVLLPHPPLTIRPPESIIGTI